MEKQKADLSQYQGPDEVRSAFEILAEIQEKRKDAQNPYCSLIPTLDRLIEGFMPGELITISGPTKNGKTLLAQTITKNFFHQQIISLWFSFEVPVAQFLSQFGADLPLIYMPSMLKTADLNWLENRILEAKAKYNVKAIFVDHLHFLFDLMAHKNTSLQIGQVIRRLKTIAVQQDLTVFLMAHTNKGDGESYMAIRDSSFVSQESDTVFMVRRHQKKKTEGMIIVEFHRRTGVLREMVPIVKVGNYFQEKMPDHTTASDDWRDQF